MHETATAVAEPESAAPVDQLPTPETSETAAEETAAPAVDETAALRAQVQELAGRLDRLNAHEQRVLLAEQHVAVCEATVLDISENLKAAKKSFDSAVDALRREIRNRDGQGTLPFPEEIEAKAEPDQAGDAEPVPQEDHAGATPLTQIGVTPSQAEKLAGLDPAVETVAQLEKLIAEGGFVPGRIKGLGETAITKISDWLIEFRREHPNPNEQPAARVDGEWDPVQYHEGQIARADGKLMTDCPHQEESHARSSWNEGWNAKDREMNGPTSAGSDDLRQPEVIAIPLSRAECGALVKVRAHEDGKFSSTIEAEVVGGLSIREEHDDDPICWESRSRAISEGCLRLGEWFRLRVPEIGSAVAVEIAKFEEQFTANVSE